MPDSSPIWARAETAAANFEARRVSRTSRGPLRAAALAVAGLGSLVALGSLDPSRATPAVDSASMVEAGIGAEPAATGALVRPSPGEGGWPPIRDGNLAFAPVSLDVPRPDDAITTNYITVQGTLLGRADEVRVTLQTQDRRRLDATVVDTTFPDGGIRPERTPTIDVRLKVPAPRPVGEQLWVVIVAYDGLGSAIRAMRRPVTIDALEAKPPRG